MIIILKIKNIYFAVWDASNFLWHEISDMIMEIMWLQQNTAH